jgi:hypothetical protein
MSDPVTQSRVASEELRLRNNQTQHQSQNELETREVQARHGDELQRLIENQTDRAQDLRKAYDVSISQEAENLEQRLHDTRLSNDQRVADEKRNEDNELNKLKTAHQQKVEEYKKSSESQLENLRKQLQAQTEQLHELARKSAQKEGVRS